MSDRKSVGFAVPILDAITGVMNEFGARRGCQPLGWNVRQAPIGLRYSLAELSRFPTGLYTDGEVLAVAARWAAAMNLTDTTDRPGHRVRRGFLDGYAVEIWAVTDRAAFDAWSASEVRLARRPR